MYKNYLTIAFRNLTRHTTFSALTVAGLAVGMAACYILIQYARFEKSYDAFNVNGKDIYRIGLSVTNETGMVTRIPKNFSALGPALKNDFAEVKAFARLFPIDGTIAVKKNTRVYNEKNIVFADESALEVFSFEFLRGSAGNALKAPYTTVITRTTAEKYFGKEDPIGKSLTLQEGEMNVQVIVEGVIEDVSDHSHLTFDFLVSHSTLSTLWGERADHSWDEALFYTYLQLNPSTDQEAFLRKLTPDLLRTYTHWPSSVKLDFITQPLSEIYLYSHLVQEMKVNGNGKQVVALWIIAVLILSLAWINYINLSTARYMERAKEVGVRKIIGAQKGQLIHQFLTESLLITFVSIFLAVVIIQAASPALGLVTGKSIPMWDEPLVGVTLFGVFISGSILSSLFPSLVLSSLQAVRVLKGKFQSSNSGVLLRKSLVVFQFIASIALAGGTVVVYRQLDYVRNMNLGTDIRHTLVLPVPDITDSTFVSKAATFKNALLGHPEIETAVSSTTVPGKADNIIQGGLSRFENSDEDGINHYNFGVDRNFIKAYGIKLLAGRNFGPTGDEHAVILNETAIRAIGFNTAEEAVGHRVTMNWAPERTVIGVVEDYHQHSLHSAIDPVVFSIDDSGQQGFYSVRFHANSAGNDLKKSIAIVQNEWARAFPGNPFDYFFLDDYFNDQYKDDIRFGRLLNIFSALSLLVACLGILGLSVHNAAHRTKEIGVRKVLGASVMDILTLLSKDYMRLILIALIVSIPLTQYFIEKWLAGYAYHINVAWWTYLGPGAAVLLISLAAISSQSIRAAISNPTDSLNS